MRPRHGRPPPVRSRLRDRARHLRLRPALREAPSSWCRESSRNQVPPNCHRRRAARSGRALTPRTHESGRPGSNRRRPAWEAFSALAAHGFFGGGSRFGITQYHWVRFRLAISRARWSSVRVSDPWPSPPFQNPRTGLFQPFAGLPQEPSVAPLGISPPSRRLDAPGGHEVSTAV